MKLLVGAASAFFWLAGCSPGGGKPEGSALPLSESARLGQEVFTKVAQPPCGMCHVLKHAGTRGTLGPNLDQLRPDSEKTRKSVVDGVGVMPSQVDVLTEEQIRAVADYVYEVAGR